MDADIDPSDPPGPGAGPAPLAWVDGRILPAEQATVPLLDEGFLRGDAVFEAVLVRRGRTHALEPHLARMGRSAAHLDLELPPLRAVARALLAAWGPHDGVLRLIVTRGGCTRGLVTTMRWPPSIALGVVEIPWRTALTGVKTLSYAANQWAVRRAQQQGADDALIVDGGLVHELPTGTVCIVRDGRVSTPDPDRLPILASVTLRQLAEVVEVARTIPTLDEVLAADEVFVVSATRPVLAVNAIVGAGGRTELPAPGPVTAAVRGRFDEHIDQTLDPPS